MSTCPICNGLATLKTSCPICQEIVEDQGRVSDFFSDYSPYQAIDLCKRSDGYIDQKIHTCPHQIYCPHCGYTDVEMVYEQDNF